MDGPERSSSKTDAEAQTARSLASKGDDVSSAMAGRW